MLYKNCFIQIFNLFLVFFVFPSYGKTFLSSYVTFDVGDNWTCKSFGVDWICHHYFHPGAKPALMLITAKEGKSKDDLNLYFQIFNQQKDSAQKIHVNKISVYSHNWLDAFYKNYLFNNMFSRYVATVCCAGEIAKIHVLVGFHAHEENYTKYSSQFLRSIKTLKLVSDVRETLKKIRSQTSQQKQDMLSYIEKILLEEEDLANPISTKKDFHVGLVILVFLVFFLSAGFYYFYYKKRRKRSSRKRKKRRKSTKKRR